MQSLTYAFRFIQACFSLALKESRLRKPWLYLWMGGVSLLVVWLLPLGVVIALLGVRVLGLILVGLLIFLLLFGLLAWGEVIALETCSIFGDLSQTDLQSPDTIHERHNFTHWGDVFLWVLVQPGLRAIQFIDQIIRPNRMAEHAWLDASYLILPVISLEDCTLSEAVERIKQLAGAHLIGFHPDLVGVRPVAAVVQWLLILGGGVLGFWVGLSIADPGTAGLFSRLFALAIGIMLAGVIALLGIGFSSFNRACYYSSLYQWALNVETARTSGETTHIVPPAILSQVMQKKNISKKD